MIQNSGLVPRASLRNCIEEPTLSCAPHPHGSLLLLGAAWEAWETWPVNRQWRVDESIFLACSQDSANFIVRRGHVLFLTGQTLSHAPGSVCVYSHLSQPFSCCIYHYINLVHLSHKSVGSLRAKGFWPLAECLYLLRLSQSVSYNDGLNDCSCTLRS